MLADADVAIRDAAELIDRSSRLRRHRDVSELDRRRGVFCPRSSECRRAEESTDGSVWSYARAKRQRRAIAVALFNGPDDVGNALSIAASKRNSLTAALAVWLVRRSHVQSS